MKLRLMFHLKDEKPVHLSNYFQQDLAISYIQDGVKYEFLHTKNHAQFLLSLGDGLLNYYQNHMHHFDLYTQKTPYHCAIIQKTLIVLDHQDMMFSCPIDDFTHSFFHTYERYVHDLLRLHHTCTNHPIIQKMNKQIYVLHQILVLRFTDINAMITE